MSTQPFIDAYSAYYRSTVWSPLDVCDDEDARGWIDRQALERASGSSLLSRLRAQHRGLAWDRIPSELYEQFTWVDLRVPLLSLHGLRSEFYAQTVAYEVAERGRFPFASDREHEGAYFVDLRPEGDRSVYFQPHDEPRLVGPLAGSIVQLLDVVAVLLDGIPPAGEPWPDAVIAEARSMDALLSEVWDRWWSRYSRSS